MKLTFVVLAVALCFALAVAASKTSFGGRLPHDVYFKKFPNVEREIVKSPQPHEVLEFGTDVPKAWNWADGVYRIDRLPLPRGAEADTLHPRS